LEEIMARAIFRFFIISVVLILVLDAAAPAKDNDSAEEAAKTPAVGHGIVPVTTKSAEARELYLHAMVKLENLHGEEAMQDMRKAVQLDPDFALANVIISFPTIDPIVDPAEQVAAREKANAAKSKVSRGEQLIIEWVTNSTEGRYVPAIQAMNEVMDEYPNDKHLAWLAGVWLENQQQWKRAIPIFERAIKLDAEFAAPLNEAAYCYARYRMYDKAFDAMQRYIGLLPNEANPQDSYAEILRMGGKFDDSLVHYHASLKIDPGFVESQLGIADTYALMGDEQRARSEYEIAIARARSRSQAANWRLNAAVTYLREGNLSGADYAFRAAAKQAHQDDLALPEAEAYRMMATYQADGNTAMQLLKKAEEVLQEKHPLIAAAREMELALVLRERASRAARDGKLPLAVKTLQKLQDMAESGQDQNIQLAYDGAAGAVLVEQGKFEEALPHLEEDDHNPVSIRLLVTVHRNMGAKNLAEDLAQVLATWNEPTLEQALVVPEFRRKEAANASSLHRM
jgi:tetratricopeptide (TPR) repeat protein